MAKIPPSDSSGDRTLNYEHLTSVMTWSYSSISTFCRCKYQFLLNYIYQVDKHPMFFASYGSFVHSLLAEYYNGKPKQSVVTSYLAGFYENVKGQYPNKDIFNRYFQSGLDCMHRLTSPVSKIIDIERKVDFDVNGIPFVGFIDLIAEKDGNIVIVDHKSHALKQRSKRATPMKSDNELDEYLKQLYLYSNPLIANGTPPSHLVFHCYRSGNIISEPFVTEDYSRAVNWASRAVKSINKERRWEPSIDFFGCTYLCPVNHQCEFYQLSFPSSSRGRWSN